MSIESAISFFIAVFIFGITPGPGTFAILARAITRGGPPCFLLALGMTISDILYLIAACFGLAVIATNWSELFTFIRIAGGCYLFYLGWKMWKAPLDLNTDNDSKVTQQGDGIQSFIQGFLISASNPKVILFYIAFLPTFIDLTAQSSSDIVLLALLTLISLMLGLMLIATCASQARRWFKSEKAMKRLNRSAGSIMAAAGAYLISRH
ncbi:LysE family translocator [uncultured Neptuniibacter sp.]|uniref:LysE family translocator n=1 Tax=uncultured Neptuniibacter sp. TaxID=502143 RepID=UPI00263801F9|nr:LysE family translocator [uncultured Neptuniibacter sp.]